MTTYCDFDYTLCDIYFAGVVSAKVIRLGEMRAGPGEISERCCGSYTDQNFL